jgi:hypothetical protein
MAQRRLKQAATARRRPAALNPGRVKLCRLIATLARRHGLGTVGLVGAHANGTAGADDPVELFITDAFSNAEKFAHSLCEKTRRAVHLYDFHFVPWAHPLLLCVRWLNVIQIPITECPRGAVTRWKLTRIGQTFEAAVRLESLPHFRAVNGFVATRTGDFLRVFEPPVGGFLL